jgi:hypothetical protein
MQSRRNRIPTLQPLVWLNLDDTDCRNPLNGGWPLLGLKSEALGDNAKATASEAVPHLEKNMNPASSVAVARAAAVT